jgi:peptidyl-tRNA hydrolase
MNKSGKAVANAYKNLGGVDWGRLLVIHDDLELPVGKVKLRTMGMGRLYNTEARLMLGVIMGYGAV